MSGELCCLWMLCRSPRVSVPYMHSPPPPGVPHRQAGRHAPPATWSPAPLLPPPHGGPQAAPASASVAHTPSLLPPAPTHGPVLCLPCSTPSRTGCPARRPQWCGASRRPRARCAWRPGPQPAWAACGRCRDRGGGGVQGSGLGDWGLGVRVYQTGAPGPIHPPSVPPPPPPPPAHGLAAPPRRPAAANWPTHTPQDPPCPRPASCVVLVPQLPTLGRPARGERHHPSSTTIKGTKGHPPTHPPPAPPRLTRGPCAPVPLRTHPATRPHGPAPPHVWSPCPSCQGPRDPTQAYICHTSGVTPQTHVWSPCPSCPYLDQPKV